MRKPIKRQKLYETLKKDIVSGLFPAGGFLPNEFELADKYGYSRDTVRSALSMLEDNKLLELLKGKGRRICPAATSDKEIPLTFLLPCADFLSETFSDIFAQRVRKILKGVSQAAFKCNRRVETVPVSPTNREHDIDWRKLDFVNADSLVIITSYWYRDLFPLLLERNCRLVFIKPQIYLYQQYKNFINKCICLTPDVKDATEKAISHLADQGCYRIALFHRFIAEPEHPVMSGYLNGLKKCSPSFSAWHELPQKRLTLSSIKKQLRDFYNKCGGFDALLIDSEIICKLRTHNIYKELGLSERIKIITTDDIEINQWVTPSLSGIVFPYENIGKNATECLLTSDFSPEEKIFNGKIIPRESTSTFKKTKLEHTFKLHGGNKHELL